MRRFLRYSLDHNRPIRGVLMAGGQLLQKTFTVLTMEGDTVTLRLGTKKTLSLPLRDILSCGYARGDRGET